MSLRSSRNPWAKLAGMYALALPGATTLGYLSAGKRGAVVCLGVGLVLLGLTAVAVGRSTRRQER